MNLDKWARQWGNKELSDFKRRLDSNVRETPFTAASQYQPSVVRETRITSPLSVLLKREEFRDELPRQKHVFDGTPLPCCLYPNGDFATPPYPDSDLPANIVTPGGTLPHTTAYTFTDGVTTLTATVDGWAFSFGGGYYVTSSGSGNRCLFGSYKNILSPFDTVFVTDLFTSNYLVNSVDTVTRVAPGSCKWAGPKTGGGMWRLEYGQTTPYTWHLKASDGSIDADKTAPQSSPAGTYGTATVA